MAVSVMHELEHERGPRLRVERNDDTLEVWLDIYHVPGVVSKRWHMLSLPNNEDGRSQECLITPLLEAAAWLIWFRGCGDELLDVGRALEPLITRADELFRGEADGYVHVTSSLFRHEVHVLASEAEQRYLRVLPDDNSVTLTVEEMDDMVDEAIADDPLDCL